jgi:hypothetical protein
MLEGSLAVHIASGGRERTLPKRAGRMSHEPAMMECAFRIGLWTMARVGVGGRQHELPTKRTPYGPQSIRPADR